WKPDTTASPEWAHIPVPIKLNCTVTAIQSIDTFNTFYPMEVIATRQETLALRQKYPGSPFLVFPEDRDHSIRMRNDLPYRWIKKGPQSTFAGSAARGENYAFQLGIYALQPLNDVRLGFSDLRDAGGHTIGKNAIECINTTGVSYDGHPFTKIVNIPAGQVQALWCVVHVPMTATPGVYTGTVHIEA